MDRKLEARLEEIEGVLFGLMQGLSLIVKLHPDQALVTSAGRHAIEDFEPVLLNSPLSDYSIQQARDVLRLLFAPPPPSGPAPERSGT